MKEGSSSFYSSFHNRGLEDAYIDGVSVTHGAPGSRQHIWSFVAALFEGGGSQYLNQICDCTTEANWPYQVPAFIGNNYFCSTARPGHEMGFTLIIQYGMVKDVFTA